MSWEKRVKEGPESRTYNKLKGEIIRIHHGAGDSELWVGKLIWVDVYTIGVAFQWEVAPDKISIVYKNAIRIDPYSIQ